MATLVWNPVSPNALILYRNGVVIKENNRNILEPVQREGYMRNVSYTMLHTHYDSDFKSIRKYHTNPDEMQKFFFIDRTLDTQQIIENIDPWLCFTESNELIMYFGEDKPVRKQKTVKTLTKHRRFWQNSNHWWGENEKHIYDYWSVKNPDKLLIFDSHLDYMMNLFPELPHKFNSYMWFLSEDKRELLIDNEPFKCSDEYDYSDEEKAEIIRKEKEAEEERQRRLWEIEERKRTPGFCSCCGSEHAEYVIDPFDYEINNQRNYRWLCTDCYNSICGDI